MNKVTKEAIDEKIQSVTYQRISDKITHCIITMANGFEVTGESAVVDPINYDSEIGAEIAFNNAFRKIWELEGYLLQEKKYRLEEFVHFSAAQKEKEFYEKHGLLREEVAKKPERADEYPVTPDESYPDEQQ